MTSAPHRTYAHGPADGLSNGRVAADAPDRATDAVRLAVPVGVGPDDVLDAFMRSVGLAHHVVAAHLWAHDADVGLLYLVAARGDRRPDSAPVDPRSSSLGTALLGQRAVLGPEFTLTDSGSEQTIWRFALPLISADVRGVAALDVAIPGSQEPDRDSLTKAAAFHRASLLGALALFDARGRVRASRLVADAVSRFQRDPADASILDELVGLLVRSLGADTASIMLADDAGVMTIRASHGLDADVIAQTAVGPGEGIAGWVLLSGSTMATHDAEGRGSGRGLGAALSAPVTDGNGVFGVVNVAVERRDHHFTRFNVTAVESIGRLIAMIVHAQDDRDEDAELFFETLAALARAIDGGDPYGPTRTDRVLEVVERLGGSLGLGEREMHAMRVAALFHDVGMNRVGPAVTTAPGPLSTVERAMLRLHPGIAADALTRVPSLADAIPIVLHHHEHYDGQGYAQGVRGHDIPLGARILAVADAFVALTSDRPYRVALSIEDALSELADKAGTQFDPHVVVTLHQLYAPA